MVVAAILLNMDSQWIPVRDSVEAALEETYGKVDRFVIKGKNIYHQIEHGEEKAKKLMARLMEIPRQQLVPVWYGAVDRDGFKYQMENIHIDSTFKERDRPFMFALDTCMTSADTWVHSTLPEDKVIWIHDEGSLNEPAREALRGFRWLRKEANWVSFDETVVPEAESHIADMIYFGDDKESSSIIVRIDAAARRKDADEVEAALSDHDLADAERAATDYQSLPGADPATVARWSKQIWTLADAQVFADSTAKKRSLDAAISEVRKNHRDAENMDKGQFTRWVVKTATVSGAAVAAGVEMKDSILKLSVDEANLQLATLSLDKLAAINDAMAARCGCDARTNVAVTETGFPAYFIRLDPETRMSEVMILPRGDRAIVSAPSN
jgi:hypothetical protein